MSQLYRSFQTVEKMNYYTVYKCYSIRGAIPYLVVKDNKSGKIIKSKQYTKRSDISKIISSVIDDVSRQIETRKKENSNAIKIKQLLMKHDEVMRKRYDIPSGVCIRTGGSVSVSQ